MAGIRRDIQQIRFINGVEVIANILHWEEDTFIEINNALMMEPLENTEDDGRSFYILKPMVSYSDNLGKGITVNPNAIMCITEPSAVVLEQYTASLRDIIHQLEDDEERKEPTSNVVSLSTKRMLTEDDDI